MSLQDATTVDAALLGTAGCAREPIHTPGAIQPYGLLLVVDAHSGQVTERAVADPAVLAAFGDPLGLPLEQVLGGRLAPLRAAIEAVPAESTQFLGALDLGPFGRHHTLAHRTADHVLIELEQPIAGEPGSLEDLYPAIRRFMSEIESAASVAELCAMAAVHVRAMAAFDRTLVYQFDANWNGAVTAEDRNDVLPSYMDLRFPESDIPAQARRLYERNRVRLIADSGYQPVPLQRQPDCNSAPTDLSLSTLRSVSPVHLQYMRNMGTGASMSVSLVREGRLWGLISCHNHTPRRVPYHVRTACEFIGQILSLQIALKERALAVEERVSRRAIQVRLLGRMAGDEDFMASLGRDPASLLALTDATGAVILHRGQCVRLGDCPGENQVMELAHWLTTEHGAQEVFHTDQLPALWPPAEGMAERASGVLAISISQLHDSFVLWFRPEVVRTVRWGGDPRKQDLHRPLSPRMSFEAWKETVDRQSLPWREVDRDAALELRTAIVDIVLRKAEEMAELNEQLIRSNKELEAFSYSVSHDLRAPFRHIVGYSELLGSAAADRLDSTERRYLDTIIESAKSAGTLVDDLLSFSQMGRSTMGRSNVDMQALANDVRNALEMEYEGRDIHWDLGALPAVNGDPRMLRLVWQNLVSNAIKFTRDSPSARIEIGHALQDDMHVFFVRDNGCGFDMRYVDKLFGVFQRLHHSDEYEGTGIGLANVRRIIERHGGQTWAEARPGEGATISFSLPSVSGDTP